MSIGDLRKEYRLRELRRGDLAADPVLQFVKWFEEAQLLCPGEANAMTLSTATPDGFVSSRVVLLKGVDERGFIFFTNYDSQKGRVIAGNPKVALGFFWQSLERQVNISGTAEKIGEEESTIYFRSRPVQSQIGAWASKQSEVVPGRSVLEQTFKEYEDQFKGRPIPKPPHWGGYVVRPELVEFWQGRPSRMHDRFLYTPTPEGSWNVRRLSP